MNIQQELDDAKTLLLRNINEFYSNTESGHKLRMNALKMFKEQYSIKTDDVVVLAIEADLANDIDVHNALLIEKMHEEDQNK